MSLNILLIAGSDDVPEKSVGAYGHKLAILSFDDFERDLEVPKETDVIVFSGAAGDKCIELWLSLEAGRPSLVVLGDQIRCEAQPDLLVLPSVVPVATLDACLRLLAENRSVRQKAEALQTRLDSNHRQVRKTLEQFIPSHSLKDGALRWWVDNSDAIEGELLLAARTPSGELNVMSVRGGWNVFPVITPFYRMSEKGFGIEAILLEMNKRLLRIHPEGLPLTATLVSVNFQMGAARIWHSDNPSPLLLRTSRNLVPIVAEPRSSLGLASSSRFQADSEVWSVHAGDRLVLCSGGLMSALDAEGWHADAVGRLESLIASGNDKKNPLRALPSNDDKMLVVIDCSPVHAQAVKSEQRPFLSPVVATDERWKLALTIGPEEMRKIDIVPLLLGVVEQFQSIQPRIGNLFLILAELYNNALDHGVLQLDSRLKCGPDGMATYLDERSRRLMSLTTGCIDISLALESQGGGNLSLWIACRDSGSGFDHRLARSQQASGEMNVLPFGRGLSLVESEASSLEFNDEGNEVRVRLSLNAPVAKLAE
ncbi:MAG TPA: SpoIIE family protein phosphatase [Rhodocyclaceae bacterium]|nr:SpoIIE family protein phosphatase [Rhodocyclaceae bacterium]